MACFSQLRLEELIGILGKRTSIAGILIDEQRSQSLRHPRRELRILIGEPNMKGVQRLEPSRPSTLRLGYHFDRAAHLYNNIFQRQLVSFLWIELELFDEL